MNPGPPVLSNLLAWDETWIVLKAADAGELWRVEISLAIAVVVIQTASSGAVPVSLMFMNWGDAIDMVV